MKQMLIGLFTTLALFAIGCTSGSGETSSPDAGADDAPMTPEPNPLIDKLCPGACAAAAECDERVETAACLEQCAKEVEGDGYLIPEVVVQLFEFINADKNEDGLRCQRMAEFTYWSLRPWEVEGAEIEVKAPSVLAYCIERMDLCWSPGGNEAGCWLRYYRYNDRYRAPILECLQAPCSSTWIDCVWNHEPKGQPWLTIPEQKSPLDD